MSTLIVIALIKIFILIAGLMTAAAYLVLLERWIAAWVQDRRGPNRVGIPLTNIRMFGLGQPLADGVKFLCKEEFTPGHVDKFLYFVAPITIFVSAMLAFAVIPFGSVLPWEIAPGGALQRMVAPGLVIGPTDRCVAISIKYKIPVVVAPGVDVGLVFLAAVGSIAVYGVLLGGWASNNKYGFLGAIRSSAQLIAYELPLGVAILGVVLACGSLRLETVIGQQARSGIWNVLLQPLGFVVFCVAAMAECGRLPFDLSECEQELVGGYHTEYSGIKLMMYLVAEFLHMITAAMLIVILFLGGWHFWGLTGSDDLISWPVVLVRIGVLAGKVMGLILFMMLIRWSWPRFRFDQLMGLAWNVMLPLGLVNVVMVAVWEEYGQRLAGRWGVSAGVAQSVCGWLVLAAAWLLCTVAVPTASDNRPRRGEELLPELERFPRP